MKRFVIVPAVAILLVIPLWAYLGALEVAEEWEEGAHGHGAVADSDGAMEDFLASVNQFIATNTREDGCVEPGPSMEMGHHDEGEEAGAHEDEHSEGMAADEHHEENQVVYLQALQFAYRPNKLCLKAGKTYDFRMMSTDVTHGASIWLGPASRIIRLPPGVVTEAEITFTEPGEYLVYCSAYCGVGHQFMSGGIIVEPPDEHDEMEMEPHGHEEEIGEIHEHEDAIIEIHETQTGEEHATTEGEPHGHEGDDHGHSGGE